MDDGTAIAQDGAPQKRVRLGVIGSQKTRVAVAMPAAATNTNVAPEARDCAEHDQKVDSHLGSGFSTGVSLFWYARGLFAIEMPSDSHRGPMQTACRQISRRLVLRGQARRDRPPRPPRPRVTPIGNNRGYTRHHGAVSLSPFEQVAGEWRSARRISHFRPRQQAALFRTIPRGSQAL